MDLFNECQFMVSPNSAARCKLKFTNVYELIHHIEEEHLPSIDEQKSMELVSLKKLKAGNLHGDYDKSLSGFLNQLVPLSLISKLNPFRKGHRVTPISPEKRRLKFSYYRKQPEVVSQNDLSGSKPSDTRKRKSSSISSSSVSVKTRATLKTYGSLSSTNDLFSMGSALTLGDLVKKFRCDVSGCGRTYKNPQGLKLHSKSVHGPQIGHSVNRLSAQEESILNRQLPGSVVLSSQQPADSTNNPRLLYSQEESINTNTKSNIEIDVQQKNELSTSTESSTAISDSSLASPTPRTTSKNSDPVKLYQCRHCTKVYKSQVNLHKHLVDSHRNATISQFENGQQTKFSSSNCTTTLQVLPPQTNLSPSLVLGPTRRVLYTSPTGQHSISGVANSAGATTAATPLIPGSPRHSCASGGGGNIIVYQAATPAHHAVQQQQKHPSLIGGHHQSIASTEFVQHQHKNHPLLSINNGGEIATTLGGPCGSTATTTITSSTNPANLLTPPLMHNKHPSHHNRQHLHQQQPSPQFPLNAEYGGAPTSALHSPVISVSTQVLPIATAVSSSALATTTATSIGGQISSSPFGLGGYQHQQQQRPPSQQQQMLANNGANAPSPLHHHSHNSHQTGTGVPPLHTNLQLSQHQQQPQQYQFVPVSNIQGYFTQQQQQQQHSTATTSAHQLQQQQHHVRQPQYISSAANTIFSQDNQTTARTIIRHSPQIFNNPNQNHTHQNSSSVIRQQHQQQTIQLPAYSTSSSHPTTESPQPTRQIFYTTHPISTTTFVQQPQQHAIIDHQQFSNGFSAASSLSSHHGANSAGAVGSGGGGGILITDLQNPQQFQQSSAANGHHFYYQGHLGEPHPTQFVSTPQINHHSSSVAVGGTGYQEFNYSTVNTAFGGGELYQFSPPPDMSGIEMEGQL